MKIVGIFGSCFFFVVLICFLSNSQQNKHRQEPLPVKTVLLWTEWFGDKSWDFFRQLNQGFGIELDDGSGRSCLMSTNRLLLNQSDAIIFHGRDLNLDDLPKNRQINRQKWVFFSMEPPTMTFEDSPWSWSALETRRVAFNWTISYSQKATVRFPYGRFLLREDKSTMMAPKSREMLRKFSKRPKDAIWIVSHCE